MEHDVDPDNDMEDLSKDLEGCAVLCGIVRYCAMLCGIVRWYTVLCDVV